MSNQQVEMIKQQTETVNQQKSLVSVTVKSSKNSTIFSSIALLISLAALLTQLLK
jgi:hypothetical protein